MPLGLQAVDPTLALEFLIRDELFEELCELALGFVVWWLGDEDLASTATAQVYGTLG